MRTLTAFIAEFDTAGWVTKRSALVQAGLDCGVVRVDDLVRENAIGVEITVKECKCWWRIRVQKAYFKHPL